MGGGGRGNHLVKVYVYSIVLLRHFTWLVGGEEGGQGKV